MEFPLHGTGAPDYIKETARSVRNLQPSGGPGRKSTPVAPILGKLKGTSAEAAKRKKKGGK